MEEKKQLEGSSELPQSVKLLAWAFILLGVLAIIQTAKSLFEDPVPSINLLVVAFFLGTGLLRHTKKARTRAIYCAFIIVAFYSIGILIQITGERPLGGLFTQMTFWSISVLAIVAGIYAIYVLNRPSVAKSFKD